eukprot:9489199-Pyramimonas_sp.AAC.2
MTAHLFQYSSRLLARTSFQVMQDEKMKLRCINPMILPVALAPVLTARCLVLTARWSVFCTAFYG